MESLKHHYPELDPLAQITSTCDTLPCVLGLWHSFGVLYVGKPDRFNWGGGLGTWGCFFSVSSG
jgi:hypothetical protein